MVVVVLVVGLDEEVDQGEDVGSLRSAAELLEAVAAQGRLSG